MKEIIDVGLKTRTVDLSKCKTEMIVAGLFSDVKTLDRTCRELDHKLDGAIEKLIELGDFKGKEETGAVLYSNERIGARRVLLVGLGEKSKATLDTVRRAAGAAAYKAVEMKLKTVSLMLHRAFGARFDPAAMGRACAEGVYFSSYRYDEFVTEDENGRLGSLSVELIDSDSAKTKGLSRGLLSGTIIGKAQSYVRTLTNQPGNVMNPAKLAAAAKKLARSSQRLSCKVFDEKQLAARGMGGLLAVGSGSQNKPRLIVLQYSPAAKAKSNRPTIGLVGKAITFDSGGLSIKPSARMDLMKLDKTGGVVVMGTIKAAAELALPLNIYGVIPAAENLPSGTSYRPGDIVTTFSGKTVEVQNTDAEGRMVLCDALSYADKQGCDIIIDIATLTGACMVALGKHKAGLMGNDDGLIKQLQKASEQSGERLWHMPSGDEYAKEMKSKIADLRNTGGKWGGACTAAAFLRQFVGQSKWAHLDIAGMDMFEEAAGLWTAGASGFGLRLLTTYLMNLAGKKG